MDLPKIKALIDLLNSSSLSALELAEGEHTLRLERQGGAVPAVAATSVAQAPVPVQPQPQLQPQVPQQSGATGHVIHAPMQGILHLTPAPGEPAFVQVGDEIRAEQVICVIEAMKMFNTVEADAAGRVAEILAVPGTEVKLGQPLLRLA
ncbi:acetyl-CoA carboxylase biotin carboxyl carrier protein [Herbaspirillum sp. NPDC087042]|uniref:acetyl-CoA carboxylase biotin carboxyl carrier protein n=1 Tax=Herbaspirillum sp. NPDC087042 TaxID=3364004 RepID=UPI0037FD513B